ncbi:MAG: TetR/AcrR family transcriptional regulator [SAR202 cluster bacterium]|nr:TetR/AcrR family transcriptional regulator [SAR202 cluster bacterium]
MPKVSEAHLEARRRHILDAAFACFARKGFHPTTMHDICAEAGVSAGALYRYFSSKEEMIAASCQLSQDHNLARLRESIDGVDTRQMVRRLADAFLSQFDGPEARVANRAALQLWAEMAVNPDVRQLMSDNLARITAGLANVVRAAQARGDWNPDLDPEAVARVMIAIHDGFVQQKAFDPAIDTASYVKAAVAIFNDTLWNPGALSRAASAAEPNAEPDAQRGKPRDAGGRGSAPKHVPRGRAPATS